mgnify:CR=1 FL=1
MRRQGRNVEVPSAINLTVASIATVLGSISDDAKGDIKQPGFVVFEWRKVDGKLTPVALK